MIVSWAFGPRGARQPVARADARVAGLLAAADLQLRRDPAGRRRPLRVRRPRCRARGLNGDRAKVDRAGRRRRRPTAATAGNGNGDGNGNGGARRRVDGSDGSRQPQSRQPAHVLVVANETVGGRKLLEAIERRAARGRSACTVICPQNQPQQGLRDLRRQRRARPPRSASSRRSTRLHELGIEATRRGDGPRSLTWRRRTPCGCGAPTRSSSRRYPTRARAGCAET